MNYRLIFAAVLLVSYSLSASAPEQAQELQELSIETSAVVQADSRSVSAHSLACMPAESPRSMPEQGSAVSTAGLPERDHAYWVRAWALLCKKANLSKKIESIGGHQLTRIGRRGEQHNLMQQLKKSLESVEVEDRCLQHRRVSNSLARALGTPTSEQDLAQDAQEEQANQETVNKTLQVLIEMLAMQNRALDAQVAQLEMIADAAETRSAADAQTIALKEQELAVAERNRAEDQIQQARDRHCARGFQLCGIVSATGNIVLGVLLANALS